MPWWGWLLLAWGIAAVSFAVFAGAAAKVIRREERSVRLAAPAPPLHDPVQAPTAGPPDPSRPRRLNGGPG